MEDFYDLFTLWRPLIACLALLGVQLILLGVILGAWATALKNRERQRRKETKSSGTTQI